MTRIFWKDIGPDLLFLVAGTIDTKFRRSTEVTTANSTNKNPNANKLIWVINKKWPYLAFQVVTLWSLSYRSSKLLWLFSCFFSAILQGFVFKEIGNAPSQDVKENSKIFASLAQLGQLMVRLQVTGSNWEETWRRGKEPPQARPKVASIGTHIWSGPDQKDLDHLLLTTWHINLHFADLLCSSLDTQVFLAPTHVSP